MCSFLAEEIFRKYFNSTSNVTLLKELVDKLKEGAENYAKHPANKREDVPVVNLLQIKEFADALKRNVNNDYKLKESIEGCTQASYCAVFSPANSKLAENIDDYLALLQPWQGYMNPLEVAEFVVEKFVWLSEAILSKTNYKNFCTAVNKLIGFTNRFTVSRLVAEAYEGSGESTELLRETVYNKLVQNGVVDKYEPAEKSTAENVLQAVQKYENTASNDPEALDKLRKKIGGIEDGKAIIASKLAEWFEKGATACVENITKYGSDLYDEATARSNLGKAIQNAVNTRDWKKLDFAVEFLPENLIDKENPIIKTVILPAYQVIHNKG